jgi:drug/metabolite transporter (DMT)-like permease
MLYLIGSIICTSYLTLSFKVTQQHNLPDIQVLFFLSIFSALTCLAINGSSVVLPAKAVGEEWLGWSAVIGFLFIVLYVLIALTTQKVGVAIAAASNRLSLIIPFIFSIAYFDEKVTDGKIIGIGIILIAVVMICLPPNRQIFTVKNIDLLQIILPASIFIGSGMRDTLVKYVQQQYLEGWNQFHFLFFSFAWAAAFGLLYMVIRLAAHKEQFDKKSIVAGVAVGSPAYFSFWCMITFLKRYEGQSGSVIPIHNMAIVILTTLIAVRLFKEKLSLVNWLGVGLSMIGILLVALV